MALSALVRGYGDVALWVLSAVLATIAIQLGEAKDVAALRWVGQRTREFLLPAVDLRQVLGARPIPLSGFAEWAFIVTLSLALAIVFLNRRELSYASSGS